MAHPARDRMRPSFPNSCTAGVAARYDIGGRLLLGAKPGKVAGTLRRAVRFSRQNASVRPKGVHLET